MSKPEDMVPDSPLSDQDIQSWLRGLPVHPHRPTEPSWPNPQLPPLPPAGYGPDDTVSEFDRAHDEIEIARREARSDALHEAVCYHGEPESQEVFRSDESEAVITTARRFFDYIWEGK